MSQCYKYKVDFFILLPQFIYSIHEKLCFLLSPKTKLRRWSGTIIRFWNLRFPMKLSEAFLKDSHHVQAGEIDRNS